ncbi:IS1634 family transposase [Synechocystis sp. FACHB-383]|uniref:IS1634 family transposase n=1 Tax=Synechocystis sp. FACHB-383 TaxID=2692864 RepID=UPI0016886E1A|nr:IS1634 family transposase [Synechocystis sp. FACHB-383]MBD2652778.1 IS1634 family transposase [Synechocystis sp. FACHB-383]
MEPELQVESLDHLGLVAGVIDELGLVELTNELLPGHHQNHLSSGEVVKAMILNSFGFLSAPLYLFSEFFESKAMGHFLGEEIEAKHLNDDRLGRVLDALYERGVTMFFLRAALQAVERFKVSTEQCHLDSSSLSVQGEYSREGEDVNAIAICRGYSRDHRPDLKQYIVNLVCSRDGGVPLWLKVASGNQSDGPGFAQIVQEFQEQWEMESLFVMDAAFYSQSNVEKVSQWKWLSRVPQTIGVAKKLIQGSREDWSPVECNLPDYQIWESQQNYGGQQQRWLLIESGNRKDNQALWEKELDKSEKKLKKELKRLQGTVFACQPDAYEALLQFTESLEYHQLVQASLQPVRSQRVPGQPRGQKSAMPVEGYRIRARLERKPDVETQLTQQSSRFILATNQLDTQQWPPQKLLEEYKQQQRVERGFRFLKDPLFFTSSVFVKKPQRVEALALIMALTLLVYALAERKLRQNLALAQETVLDQRRRPTDKPTFRWILQKFQGIHLVVLNGVQQITNLTDERRRIIQLFGIYTSRYYLLTNTTLTCGM